MWINPNELTNFIFASQDSDTGGISDRPGNYPDPFHTLFGLAGLSLLSRSDIDRRSPSPPVATATSSKNPQENGGGDADALTAASTNLRDINPVLCMPQYIIDRLSLTVQTI